MSSPPATPRTPSPPPRRSSARARARAGSGTWTGRRTSGRIARRRRAMLAGDRVVGRGPSALPAARAGNAGSAAGRWCTRTGRRRRGSGASRGRRAGPRRGGERGGPRPLERVRAFVPACRALPGGAPRAPAGASGRDARGLAARRRERRALRRRRVQARVLGLVGAPATPLDDDAPRDDRRVPAPRAGRGVLAVLRLFGAIHEVHGSRGVMPRRGGGGDGLGRDGVAYLELRRRP